jgi:PAS domain-containing protein
MLPFLILVILSLLVGLLSSWRRNRKLLAQACSRSDTAEHKRAEEERQALSHDLQESKTRLEEAQRVARMGHYYWDLIANRVIWSDELYRIYGLTPPCAMAESANTPAIRIPGQGRCQIVSYPFTSGGF